MTSCLAVRLGDLDFSTKHGEEIITPSGAVLSLHEVRGWDEPAPDATPTYASSTGDGHQIGMLQTGPRQITLTGLVITDRRFGLSSPSMVTHHINRHRRMSRFTVTEVDGLKLEADVRVTDWQMSRASGAAQLAQFTLLLEAPDPLRYTAGCLDLPAGITMLPNGGDRQAWPTITASGPLTVFVDAPGGQMKANIGSGSHTIHTRTGRIYTSSGIQLHRSLFGPMPYVLPGGSQWDVSGVASGAIRVRHWEAWS